MDKKKNRKLLFQMGVVIVPLCLFMLALFSATVYKSTIDAYLKARRDGMAKELDDSFGTILGVDGSIHGADVDLWFYDALEANPGLAREPLTEAQREQILQAMRDGEDVWSLEWLARQSSDTLSIITRMWLEDMAQMAGWMGEQHDYDDLFLIDVRDEKEGFVYLYWSRDNDRFASGDTFRLNLSAHPALKRLLDDPDKADAFERVRDFPDEGSYNYICYQPLVLNGETRAVMGISCGWDHLRSEMTAILRHAFMVGIGGLVLALFFILLTLYKRALAPVSRIQQSILHYTRTRDTEQVVKELHEVREQNELGLLADNLSQMVTEIDRYTTENIRLAQERERLETELKLAGEIQIASLPKRAPKHEAFDLSASMTPAKEVGGDFYDFFFLDDTHLALVIADVSGKGIPAALFMMMVKNMIKNYAESGLSPAEILSLTNRNILENDESSMFVTVWLGIYEIPTGRIRAVNAGHEYPMIRKSGGRFELFKDRHGLVIGGDEAAVYREYELQLDIGETLFLYTDGAPEATNRAEKLLGTDGVLQALNQDPDGSPNELIGHIGDAIHNFVGDAPQFDDLTMLAIRRIK